MTVATIWEIANKASSGKLEIPGTLGAFVEGQLEATSTRVLDVRAVHAVTVEDLPWHHRELDRLLVAQARFEKLPILGRHGTLDDNGTERIW